MRVQYALLCILLTAVVIAAEYPFDADLYDAEELTATVRTDSQVTLVGSNKAEKLTATVHYVPEDAGTLITEPDAASINPLYFEWRNIGPGTYKFWYETEVTNHVQRPLIKNSIDYPFTSPEEVTQYLQPQEITDTTGAIRRLSAELSSGKSDSIEVVFNIAQWVRQNIEYDLNSVTAQASQKSSWVIQNRYGVCDELTSLFISLSREAGIPARFVSGIAYTNLETDFWGPHGWAEVWLPDVGWVPVDVTYGQVFYVDTTHIAIRHSLDAKNTAVDYGLLSKGLSMQPGELITKATVKSKRGNIEEQLSLNLEALYDYVGSESGDLITAHVKNNENYYIATDLFLATTPDTEVHDEQNKALLLPPKTSRAVSWRVTFPKFNKGYEYTVPFTVIAQNAGNATSAVTGGTQYKSYPLPPSGISTVSSVSIECTKPQDLYIGERTSATCKSQGSLLCTEQCTKDEITVEFEAKNTGAYPIVVTATKGADIGTAIVTFVVTQPPNPSVSANVPSTVTLDDSPTLVIKVSTAPISDAKITAKGKRFMQEWNASVLDEKQYELRFSAAYLDAGENTITITIEGLDKNKNTVSRSTQAVITLQTTFWERVSLFFSHLF